MDAELLGQADRAVDAEGIGVVVIASRGIFARGIEVIIARTDAPTLDRGVHREAEIIAGLIPTSAGIEAIDETGVGGRAGQEAPVIRSGQCDGRHVSLVGLGAW